MKKQIYIKPRQSGKTIQTIELIKRVEGKCLIVCYNNAGVEDYKRKLREYYNKEKIHFAYYSNFKADNISKLNGIVFDLVVCDEFLMPWFDHIKDTYCTINSISHRIKCLYMVSTPNGTIQTDMYEYIRDNKLTLCYELLLEKAQKMWWVDKDTFDLWYWNFITDPDTNVVKDDFFFSYRTNEEIMSTMGEEAFKEQYLNQIFL